jgi:hypothetical protein
MQKKRSKAGGKMGVQKPPKTAKNTVKQGLWEQRRKILAAGNPKKHSKIHDDLTDKSTNNWPKVGL